MTVWVMTVGYDYEGSDVEAVFTSRALAEAAVERYIAKDGQDYADREWHVYTESADYKTWYRGSKSLTIAEFECDPSS